MLDRWRTVRVFISSTFRDMHAERDYLVKELFPLLRAELAKRRIHLIDVDLRWGVTEEQAQQGIIQQVCFDEIERCRPFFFCFLGERYGWVPPNQELSITAQEVERAALHPSVLKEEKTGKITWYKKIVSLFHRPKKKPKDELRAFFYFRNPNFIEKLPSPEQREIYLDFLPNGALDKVGMKKQQLLKQKIAQNGYPVYEYQALWDNTLSTPENFEPKKAKSWNEKATTGRLTNFALLGEKIKSDLFAAIAKEFPVEEKELDPLEEEKAMHLAFVAQRSQVYLGRKEQKDAVTQYVRGETHWTLVVLGSPGSGKTSFLSSWYEEYSKTYPEDYVLVHFIGASPDSTEMEKTISRLCAELKRTFHLEGSIPHNIKELAKTFQDFLYEASKLGKRIVVVLDALNQMNHQHNAHLLEWLPLFYPNNVRFVLSTLPGTCLDSLRQRTITEFPLAPLSQSEKESILKEVLKLYGKELSSEQCQMLLHNPGTENPLFLRVALEELRLFGSFQNLSQRITDFPSDTVSLFGQVLARLESEQGEELVRKVLSFLASSRYGLEEQEILELLRDANGNPLPRVYWAKLYRSLIFYLIQKGSIYSFFHDQLKEAVSARYMKDGKGQKYHKILADFFSRTPNIRKVPELPYQLQKAEEWQMLAELLTNLDFFVMATPEENFLEVRGYWVSIGNRFSPAQWYVKTLEEKERAGGKTEEVVELYNRVGKLLRELGLYNEATSILEKALAIVTERLPEHSLIEECYYELGRAYKNKGEYLKSTEYYNKALFIQINKLGLEHLKVGTTYAGLGVVYYLQGQYENALEFHHKALAIALIKLGSEHPNMANTYGDIGLIYHDQGQYEKALEFYRKCLAIELSKLGSEHPRVSTSYCNMGFIYHDQGQYEKALEFYQKALTIELSKLGSEHPEVGNTYDCFGRTYQEQGQYEKALEFHQKALAIELSKLDSEHPEVAITYRNLGTLYRAQGEYAKAKEFLEKALAVFLSKLGSDHPHTAFCYYQLGRLYVAQSQYEKAQEFYQKALEIRVNKLGEKHPDVAATHFAMGVADAKAGHSEKALKYFRDAYVVLSEKLPHHRDTKECKDWLEKIEKV